MQKIRIIGQFFGIATLTAVIVYTILSNFAPLGITVYYSLTQNQKNNLEVGPKERIKNDTSQGYTMIHQLHDLIYFTTTMPFHFDEATVRITFRNPNPNQVLSLGFQDRNMWHYDTQLFDVPFLNNLSWNKVGKNPTLFQKNKNFNNVDEFLKNPPQGLLIGTYGYDTTIGNAQLSLPGYRPAHQETIIDVPLRGKHILYTYLENEPFHMVIQKQDLNWYEDPDIMTVNVYKDDDLVYQLIADDDGIQDASKRILPPQELDISNPGPDLPESGVYKIVIESDGDTLIKRITTNLHKIVFANTLFPVANTTAYWPTVASTSATTLYTNSLVLSAMTYHNAGLQDIVVDNQNFPIIGVKNLSFIIPQDRITKVIVPKSDVIINGFQGFFSFESDQFFDPTPYHIVPISSKTDVDFVDYILANYVPSETYGDWQTAEKTFDISSAFIKNDKLNWVIMAPKLQENNHEILIKNIEITFHKKPWLNKLNM